MNDDDSEGWGFVLPLAAASLSGYCLYVKAIGEDSSVLQSYLVGVAAIVLVVFVVRGRVRAAVAWVFGRKVPRPTDGYWFSDDSWVDLAAVIAIAGVASLVEVSDPRRLRMGLGVVGVISIAKLLQFALSRRSRRSAVRGVKSQRD